MKSGNLSLALAFMGAAVCDVAYAQSPVRYLVRVEDPRTQLYHVEATFPASGATTLLSLPAWTPGHYEIENYARYVRDFSAHAGGRPLDWDKLDKDTWRVRSAGVEEVTIRFDYLADTADLSMSVLREDFGFFNGTNLFPFPAGGLDFAAELRLELPDGWRVATELEETGAPFVYRASDFHELVDNPTFIGHFAIDSVRVDGVWTRLAVYPARYMRDPAREMALKALAAIAEATHALFDGPPYDRYTTFVLLEEDFAFLAGLEHADSHVDIMPAIMFDQPQLAFRGFLYRLFSHEYYHAWNVKRIRPAGLWPYQYDREQPTPLLWVSEGITDYYAHVVLTRAGLWGENEFWLAMREAINSVTGAEQVAVEDASVSTWMEPTEGDRYIYYDKGALLGLLLDIEIRDASDNRASLDDVMRRLYRERYREGSGFSTEDFLAYVGEHMGREEAQAFYRDYVDGRRPLPLQQTLARAGMRYEADTIIEPYLGLRATANREGRVIVREVVAGTAADRAGLRSGDQLVRVGSLAIEGNEWSDEFRRTYGGSTGVEVSLSYRRGGELFSEPVELGVRTRLTHRLQPLEDANQRQLALKRAILRGDGEARSEADRP